LFVQQLRRELLDRGFTPSTLEDDDVLMLAASIVQRGCWGTDEHRDKDVGGAEEQGAAPPLATGDSESQPVAAAPEPQPETEAEPHLCPICLRKAAQSGTPLISESQAA
jgi:hypothetical protein